MSFLDDASVLITGGTGSFGRALTKRLINSKARRIAIFSRDELKQLESIHGEAAQEVIASHVNAALSVPIDRDASLLFRIILVALWLLLVGLPVFLLVGPFLDFTWYFETL